MSSLVVLTTYFCNAGQGYVAAFYTSLAESEGSVNTAPVHVYTLDYLFIPFSK